LWVKYIEPPIHGISNPIPLEYQTFSCLKLYHLIFTWIDLMLTFHLFIGLAQTGWNQSSPVNVLSVIETRKTNYVNEKYPFSK
jgi:hypothetical protein